MDLAGVVVGLGVVAFAKKSFEGWLGGKSRVSSVWVGKGSEWYKGDTKG